MKDYLLIGQIIVSVLLIIFILMQNKSSALGSAFGGDSNIYRSKRGMEGFLHWGTVVLSFLFLAGSIANLLLA